MLSIIPTAILAGRRRSRATMTAFTLIGGWVAPARVCPRITSQFAGLATSGLKEAPTISLTALTMVSASGSVTCSSSMPGMASRQLGPSWTRPFPVGLTLCVSSTMRVGVGLLLMSRGIVLLRVMSGAGSTTLIAICRDPQHWCAMTRP